MNDLPAEFYLETVERVFQTYDLPLGKLTVGDRTVNPAAIRHTALLTVEGERDDICAVGQTVAAQDLCTGIRPYLKIAPPAGGRGPLRRVQRQQVEPADLPAGARDDPHGLRRCTGRAARPLRSPPETLGFLRPRQAFAQPRR